RHVAIQLHSPHRSEIVIQLRQPHGQAVLGSPNQGAADKGKRANIAVEKRDYAGPLLTRLHVVGNCESSDFYSFHFTLHRLSGLVSRNARQGPPWSSKCERPAGTSADAADAPAARLAW